MENEEKKTSKPKSEASKGGVHYDKQSKSLAFRAIRDGKDVRKKGYEYSNVEGFLKLFICFGTCTAYVLDNPRYIPNNVRR